MPRGSDPAALGGSLLRILCYGREKLKKTWWSLLAAETGRNVILLDGDDGSSIIRQVEPKLRERVIIANLVNEFARPVFADFLTVGLKGSEFIWDEQKKDLLRVRAQLRQDHSHLRIDLRRLGPSDVLVVDSYTALVHSANMGYAIRNGIDLSDADESKVEWDGYGWVGRYLNWVLDQLHALPCHVVIIGHAYNYEKYRGERKNRKLLWEREIPMSSSGPHSNLIGRHFSDILYFQPAGPNVQINTRTDPQRMGGSRLIKPDVYQWDALSFRKVCEQLGVPDVTPVPCVGIQYFAPGEDPFPTPPPSSAPTTGLLSGASSGGKLKLNLGGKK